MPRQQLGLRLSAEVRHAAVLGHPVAHSLSPVLHRAAYEALRLAWTYEAIDCGTAQLPALLDTRRDWAGFSCTMPLKHVALDVAEQVGDAAAAVGAANTLLPAPGGWRAENTDVDGIVAALAEHDVAPRAVTVLGAGGTAQACLAALARLGVGRCDVLVRDPARAAGVAATAQRVGVEARVTRLDAATDAWQADLVVSTLPAGAADAWADRPWHAGQAVLDVVYAGWPTPLAAAARAAEATVVSGALMLLHQAAAQVTLMTGEPAPLPEMRAALAAAVPGCGV